MRGWISREVRLSVMNDGSGRDEVGKRERAASELALNDLTLYLPRVSAQPLSAASPLAR